MIELQVLQIKALIEQGKALPPWETTEGKQVWKTKSEYFVWLRGCIRRIWTDYPLRKEWKAGQLRLVTQNERNLKKFHPSTKNVGQCVFCKEWFAGSKLECDHIVESEGCYDFESAEKFLWHCAAQNGDNFQLACKPCHKIKSYQVKMGLDTFEEAACHKKAIDICKKGDKVWLSKRGVKPASNAKERRKQVVELLLKEM